MTWYLVVRSHARYILMWLKGFGKFHAFDRFCAWYRRSGVVQSGTNCTFWVCFLRFSLVSRPFKYAPIGLKISGSKEHHLTQKLCFLYAIIFISPPRYCLSQKKKRRRPAQISQLGAWGKKKRVFVISRPFKGGMTWYLVVRSHARYILMF